MKKRLALMCCIVFCMLAIAGCSFSLVKTNENFDKETLASNTDSFVSSWFECDFDSIISSIETNYAGQVDEDTIALYKESSELRKNYGEFSEKEDTDFTITTDTATVNETVLTSSGKKLVFSVTYDEDGNTSSWKVEEYKSLGETMAKAGLNTIMSMAIVFIVLIFIAIIIAQFKRIGNLQNKKTAPALEPEPAPAEVPMEVISDQEDKDNEDLSDDLELVAIITAAIMAASENECTDGLRIRSIIRR